MGRKFWVLRRNATSGRNQSRTEFIPLGTERIPTASPARHISPHPLSSSFSRWPSIVSANQNRAQERGKIASLFSFTLITADLDCYTGVAEVFFPFLHETCRLLIPNPMPTADSDAAQAISVPDGLPIEEIHCTVEGVTTKAFDERWTDEFYLCHLRFSVRIGGKTTWCLLTVPATDTLSQLPLEILEDR